MNPEYDKTVRHNPIAVIKLGANKRDGHIDPRRTMVTGLLLGQGMSLLADETKGTQGSMGAQGAKVPSPWCVQVVTFSGVRILGWLSFGDGCWLGIVECCLYEVCDLKNNYYVFSSLVCWSENLTVSGLPIVLKVCRHMRVVVIY